VGLGQLALVKRIKFSEEPPFRSCMHFDLQRSDKAQTIDASQLLPVLTRNGVRLAFRKVFPNQTTLPASTRSYIHAVG